MRTTEDVACWTLIEAQRSAVIARVERATTKEWVVLDVLLNQVADARLRGCLTDAANDLLLASVEATVEAVTEATSV